MMLDLAITRAALEWFAVFGGMVVLDIIWACYVRALQHKSNHAGVWAAAMICTSGFVTISYVMDHWLLIPAAVGAFVGTFIGARIANYLEPAK